MIQRQVIDRLRDRAVPPLRLIEGAGDLAALTRNPPDASLPAAFVVPLASAGGRNNLAAGGFRQRIEETVAVVLMHRNLRDARGGQAALDLADDVIPAIRAALAGWQPTQAMEPLELRSAGLIAIQDGMLSWREVFATAAQLRTA